MVTDSEKEPRGTTTEVRFGGVGGQGIVLAGRLLGKAAALFDGKEAVCTQSYGPEARGGASRADVVIADGPVDYPFVTAPDLLVVMFQEAYDRFRATVKPGGLVIIDSGLVRARDEQVVCSVPATATADAVGNRLAANVVMLGYLVGRTGIVSRESVEQAIRSTLKPGIVEVNLDAFAAGLELAPGEAVA